MKHFPKLKGHYFLPLLFFKQVSCQQTINSGINIKEAHSQWETGNHHCCARLSVSWIPASIMSHTVCGVQSRFVALDLKDETDDIQFFCECYLILWKFQNQQHVSRLDSPHYKLWRFHWHRVVYHVTISFKKTFQKQIYFVSPYPQEQ